MGTVSAGENPGEVTIGVVGAEVFVQRVADEARKDATTSYRIMASAYTREVDALEVTQRIVNDVDVVLFAGPLPYDIVTSAGELPVPAMFVPTGGVALPTTLLRGVEEGIVELSRISIDSVEAYEVDELYAQLGVPTDDVHVMEYHQNDQPARFAEFHRKLYEAGATSGALTTVPTVYQQLVAAGVPVLHMTAAGLTLRSALKTARLIGARAKLDDSRIAIVIVRLPEAALPSRPSSADYWYQDLKLSMHRALLKEARKMDALVTPFGERGYMVVATMGSLRVGTDNLTRPPFVASVVEAISIQPEVGIGLGATTIEAEGRAHEAIRLVAERGGVHAYLIASNGAPMALLGSSDGSVPVEDDVEDSRHTILRDLIAAIESAGDDTRIVDAEYVAGLQGGSLRTARRTLRSLVEAGLAWQMPPARVQKAGRPALRFQLLDEQLSTKEN